MRSIAPAVASELKYAAATYMFFVDPAPLARSMFSSISGLNRAISIMPAVFGELAVEQHCILTDEQHQHGLGA